jgi:hypothetical protein
MSLVEYACNNQIARLNISHCGAEPRKPAMMIVGARPWVSASSKYAV